MDQSATAGERDTHASLIAPKSKAAKSARPQLTQHEYDETLRNLSEGQRSHCATAVGGVASDGAFCYATNSGMIPVCSEPRSRR